MVRDLPALCRSVRLACMESLSDALSGLSYRRMVTGQEITMRDTWTR